MAIGIASIAAGFLLRASRITVEASLYVMIGFLTSGALRVWFGPRKLRTFFGDGRWSAPLRAWGVAITFLPVCALGVLPVLAELRRSGVRRHAVLTFALAAPMLNPISLLYGISYLGPQVLGLMVLGSFVVSVGCGVLIGSGQASLDSHPDETPPQPGVERLSAAFRHAANAASGSIWRDLAVGVLAAALLASIIPETSPASAFFDTDPSAIPRMLVFAPVTYVAPEKVITLIPEFLKFGQSLGAMFLLLTLGAGITLGHLTFASREFGKISTARWLTGLLGLSLVFALGVEHVSSHVGTANLDNDHLAEFANPFLPSSGFDGFGRHLRGMLHLLGPLRWGSCGCLAVLVLCGLMGRRHGWGPARDFSTVRSAPHPASRWERPVPRWITSSLGIAGVGAMAFLGLFAYFPAPSEAFQDMTIIKADLFGELSTASPAVLQHQLDLWDRQAARLPVGATIRLDWPSSEARRLTTDLRDQIATLRRTVESAPRSTFLGEFLRVQQVHDRCRRAYSHHG